MCPYIHLCDILLCDMVSHLEVLSRCLLHYWKLPQTSYGHRRTLTWLSSWAGPTGESKNQNRITLFCRCLSTNRNWVTSYKFIRNQDKERKSISQSNRPTGQTIMLPLLFHSFFLWSLILKKKNNLMWNNVEGSFLLLCLPIATPQGKQLWNDQ